MGREALGAREGGGCQFPRSSRGGEGHVTPQLANQVKGTLVGGWGLCRAMGARM